MIGYLSDFSNDAYRQAFDSPGITALTNTAFAVDALPIPNLNSKSRAIDLTMAGTTRAAPTGSRRERPARASQDDGHRGKRKQEEK